MTKFYKIKDFNKFENLRQTYGWVGTDKQIEENINDMISKYKCLIVELELLTTIGILESEVGE